MSARGTPDAHSYAGRICSSDSGGIVSSPCSRSSSTKRRIAVAQAAMALLDARRRKVAARRLGPLAAAVLGDQAHQRRGELLGFQAVEHPGGDRVGDQQRALAVERAGEPPEVGGHVAVEEAGGAQHRAMGRNSRRKRCCARSSSSSAPARVVSMSAIRWWWAAMLAEVRAVAAGRFVEPLLERPGGASQRLVALPGIRPGLAVAAAARVGPVPAPDPAERELSLAELRAWW